MRPWRSGIPHETNFRRLFESRHLGRRRRLKQLLMDATQAEPDVIAAVSILTSPLEPPAMSLALRLWCRWPTAGSLSGRILARVRQDAAAKNQCAAFGRFTFKRGA